MVTCTPTIGLKPAPIHPTSPKKRSNRTSSPKNPSTLKPTSFHIPPLLNAYKPLYLSNLTHKIPSLNFILYLLLLFITSNELVADKKNKYGEAQKATGIKILVLIYNKNFHYKRKRTQSATKTLSIAESSNLRYGRGHQQAVP